MNITQKRTEQLQRREAPPLTPGAVVAGILEEQGVTQTQAAAAMQVSRATLNELVNGRRSLTPDMACRLGRYFGNGPGVWLRMQQTNDLWDALHMDTTPYQSIVPLSKVA